MQASTSMTLSQSDIDKNLKLDEEKDAMKYLTESAEYSTFLFDKIAEKMVNALEESVNELCAGCRGEGTHHVLCKTNLNSNMTELFLHMWELMDINDLNEQCMDYKKYHQTKDQFSRDKNWMNYLMETFFIRYFRLITE